MYFSRKENSFTHLGNHKLVPTEFKGTLIPPISTVVAGSSHPMSIRRLIFNFVFWPLEIISSD